jgi:hypothetical protein
MLSIAAGTEVPLIGADKVKMAVDESAVKTTEK